MKHFHYDMIGANIDAHVTTHPKEDMERLGFSVVKSEPVAVADCWWFRCDKYPDKYPSYILPMKDDFKFTDEKQTIIQ